MRPPPAKPELGRFGVFGGVLSPQEAKDVEALGYGAIWVGNSPPSDLAWVEPMLESTSTLQVASGIVNIWKGDAAGVATSFHRVDAAYPGRFLLGIGVGHPEANQQYRTPIQALSAFLDELDEHGVPTNRRVVAAIGPRLLTLAGQRSAGAHPYLTTPEHTARAREMLGPRAFLAPEHKVVVDADTEAARAIGRERLDLYLGLSNAVTNFGRLGFTARDVAKPGSDHLIDAVVAHGTVGAIAARVTQHHDAGADHVALQVLTSPGQLVADLAALAGPLGLS